MVMDGSGGESAPSPMEVVLMAAGGCSSVDVVDGLKQHGQRVSACSAKLTTERRDIAPRLFTKVNIHFEISGDLAWTLTLLRRSRQTHYKNIAQRA